MTLILPFALIGIFYIVMSKNRIAESIGHNYKVTHMLMNVGWLQNPWLCGIFLFILNAFLFTSVIIGLFVLNFLSIPFLHLLIMLFGVVGSVFTWIQVGFAWQGTVQNRLKMGITGSSFYLFLSIALVHRLVTLQPAHPADDTFMTALGLLFGITVTSAPFVTCLAYTTIRKI